MEEQPTTIRVYPGDLHPLYYTSVLAFPSTNTVEVIRLTLERLQIFEDKSLYELYEGQADKNKADWTKLSEGDCPVIMQAKWKRTESREQEVRFHLRRKEHASLVLADIVSQYISPEVNEGRMEDMCNLEDFTEQDMLSNLRARFCNKDIYTYVGSILISINPYYFYSIYNPKYGSMYQGKQLGSLPPHIFAVADSSYHAMLNERQNQSVIISGESGAGKTEATKFLLHHLMNLSAKLDESQSLELITLGTGPVLEAFGNARTVANNNSSRFGKFILVQFRENGAYHGSSIEKYLLEKSRIVSQAPGERNYHVFYYLLVGADAELKKKLMLLDINEYSYLAQGADLAPENGAEEYHRLRQSLSMLKFGSEVQMGMFTVLSAILQLGNVTIEKKEVEEGMEVADIKNMEAVEIIASLLRVDVKTLQSALITRTSRAGGTDSFVRPYRVEQAIAARDSMAKALYSSLFDWIVDKVNCTLSIASHNLPHKGNSIGVLDIFGFEVFLKNSFEQFCINYANEQLQQYFNKHIFKVEQAEYIVEGIEWSSVSFVDNQDCLDLIARKPTGLLPLLDEECSFPGADDNSLFQKFERQHKTDPCYHSPQLKLQDPQFTIIHYASEVTYSIKGFREKNRDLMRQDIIDVLKTSHMDLVRALIGQLTYAVRCWRMAHLKIMAAFAFRKAGQDFNKKKDSHSLPFKLRGSPSAGTLSTPYRIQNTSEGFHGRTMSADKDTVDALIVDRARLHANAGMRPSRSFDILPRSDDSCEEGEVSSERHAETSSGDFLSLSAGAEYTPYGASPMTSRRKPGTGKTPPPVMPKSLTMPVSSGGLKKLAEGKDSEGKDGVIEKRTKKAPVDTPAQQKPSSEQEPGSSRKLPSFLRKQESRLASISKMQERLLKRLSRRSKEAPEMRERPSNQYWSSAPRIMYDGSSIGPSSLVRSSSMRHGPPKTVSAQFQLSLILLVERLEKTNPFFVRCIKSNGEKAPCNFDDDLVLRQLRYTGMMETIKIRQAGYPVRMEFELFYEKYQFLMGPKSEDLPGQIEKFLADLGFGDGNIQIGQTKVFMREKQKQALQAELGEKVLARIIKIQRWVRAKLLKCRFLHLKRCTITLQCAVRCWLARKKVDAIRRQVCSAVLIQSAWRSFVARKELVLLKQAAIILQAHWRGRTARLAYRRRLVEEHQRRELEEQERVARELRISEELRLAEQQRLAEEERRGAELKLKEEEAEAEQQRIREEQREAAQKWITEEDRDLAVERSVLAEEERLAAKSMEEIRESTGAVEVLLEREDEETAGATARLLEEEEEEKEARALVEEMGQIADEQLQLLEKQVKEEEEKGLSRLKPVDSDPRCLSVQSTGSSSTPLEVRETLFHFDTIISALVAETMTDPTPSPHPVPRPSSSSPVPSSMPSTAPLTCSSRSLTPVTPSTFPTTCDASTEPDHVTTTSEGDAREGSGEANNPPINFSNGLPKTPPIQVRNTAKVDALKQQFLIPQQLPTTASPSPPLDDIHTSRGKVKDLIAQMDESERVAPSSPLLEEDLTMIRNSRTISSAITNLTAQSREGGMAEGMRSYTPPNVRRKVTSPFLDQGKEVARDAERGSPPGTSPDTDTKQRGNKQESVRGPSPIIGAGMSPDTKPKGLSPIPAEAPSDAKQREEDSGPIPEEEEEGVSGHSPIPMGIQPSVKQKPIAGNASPDIKQRSQSLIPEGMSPETKKRSLSPIPGEMSPGTKQRGPSLIPEGVSPGTRQRGLSGGEQRSLSPIPGTTSPGTRQRGLSPIPGETSSGTRQKSLSPIPGATSPGTSQRSRSPFPTCADMMQRGQSSSSPRVDAFEEEDQGQMRARTPVAEGHEGTTTEHQQVGRSLRERAGVISVQGKEEPTKGVFQIDQRKIDAILKADAIPGREEGVSANSNSATPSQESDIPAIPPRSSSLYSRREASLRKQEAEEAQYSGALPLVLDSGGGKNSERGTDDDHLVALVFPRKQSRSQQTSTSSYQQGGNYQTSSNYHLRSGSYQALGNNRTPSSNYQSSTQPFPSKDKPEKKRSNPVSLDDVFLSFETAPSGNKGPGKEFLATIAHDLTSSSSHGELPVLGQGPPLPPPQDLPKRLLESQKQYDHLPPLDPPPGVGSNYYRTRSSSDVTSHRIRQIRKANAIKEAGYTASEVVPRDHPSSEDRYHSMQKRKRDALSLADPIEILKTRGLGGGPALEASSEFTRCLTSDEIMSLNQPPSITSPSERLRLFSFTKRHLKLPFSKSKGKKEKDLRDKLVSPDKEMHPAAVAATPGKHRRYSPTSGGKGAHFQDKPEGPRRNSKYPVALAHNFQQTTASKFGVYTCAACSKGFTGFMKQALKCVDCSVMVHRHCMVRAPPCKAHIESGSYVTMSRRKIIHKPEDLDDLGRFLLEKIAVIVRGSSQTSVVDKVFKHSLKEFHTFLISTYSLSLQSSVESSSDKAPVIKEEPKISLTFSQLVFNFDSIFRSIAKREGLNDPCHIAIGVNQIRTFLDEFGKSRRTRKYSSNINPHALRRKTNSGRAIQPKVHKGHKFLPQQFKVLTICEHCSKAIPLLESGEVCEVCGCAYHEGCYRKVHKKCEGKARTKGIPEYKSPDDKKVTGSQFGVPLQNLVPPNTIKVPTVLEVCLHFLEANGLYTQGLYRKSAGSSSKNAVRAALEEDPETVVLENYSVHAVAAAVSAFFRELPEPLLTWDMYLEFIRAMDLTSKKERQETLHKLISRLPEINHAVFERFIFHLARVAQHEHINKMGPSNLAIIFAPCLLRDRELKNPESANEMLRDLQKQTSCLETIITEQVDKLTATIRGIRTLTSFARETETKLSELASLAEVSESAASTPSSTLKQLRTKTKGETSSSGLTTEERNRLTTTLEEIERERAELAVNLPKLEPFLATTLDEGGHASGDSDRWTPTPSPSPSPSPAAMSTGTRTYRGFSPITESSAEYPASRNRSHSSGGRGRKETSPMLTLTPPLAAGSSLFVSSSSPTTPTSATPTSTHEFPLPLMPVGPVLPALTKNRVSHRPPVRPPTTTTSRQVQVKAQPLRDGGSSKWRPTKSSSSGTESDMSASDEELLYETTV